MSCKWQTYESVIRILLHTMLRTALEAEVAELFSWPCFQ